MPKLQLSLAFGRNLRSAAVLDGAVPVEGVELLANESHPADTFWRQLKFRQFDASEMSLSSLLMAVDRGLTDWTAIPVFTTRSFFHTRPYVRKDAGITSPSDLRGKRVGVPEYQQTAALWLRGALQHDFSVAPSEISWFMERRPDRSHGGALGFHPPADIELTYVPEEATIAEMLCDGELDALTMIPSVNLLDRSTRDIRTDSRVRALFPDVEAECARYYKETGIFPINHALVLRRELAERHPWLPINLYQAFAASKQLGEKEWRADSVPYVMSGVVRMETHDVMPYGLQRNLKVLQTLTSYSHEQGLTSRQLELEQVFHESTWGL